MFVGGESVQVITAPEDFDAYGNAVRDWDAATERPMTCLVGSAGSFEPLTDARNPVDSDFDLVFPASDPGITAHDRVRVRGLVCKVAGRPLSWQWPTGGQAGTVVRVKIREG